MRTYNYLISLLTNIDRFLKTSNSEYTELGISLVIQEFIERLERCRDALVDLINA